MGFVALCRDQIRNHAGHRLSRSKEALGGSEVASLAQHHVDHGAITVVREASDQLLP